MSPGAPGKPWSPPHPRHFWSFRLSHMSLWVYLLAVTALCWCSWVLPQRPPSLCYGPGEKRPRPSMMLLGSPRGADKPRVLQKFKGGHHVRWDYAARLFSLIQTWNLFLVLIAKASHPMYPSLLHAWCCTKTSMSHISRSAHNTLDVVLSSLLFTGRPFGGPGGSRRSWDLNLI